MGDLGDGWHTVITSRIDHLSQSQLEAHERQILREWEASRGHWSGIGKHIPLDDFTEAKKLHPRLKLTSDTPLGSGSFGVVQKVRFISNNRTICLARKLVRPPNRRFPIQLLREEANVMEKLDHDHIVKLVGTYCIRTDFYLLLWPVAVCNLDSLMADVDCLRTGQGDREDIVQRLHALDLNNLGAIERDRSSTQAPLSPGNCPLQYLRQIMGCITRAVAYCHQENIRHLDLKPSNILLNPGRVYLADFGIAKDVRDRDHTMTRGQAGTPKWRAPELHQNQNDWSMKAADVYSLGMILLNMATVIHDGPLDDFDAVLGDLSEGRAEKLHRYLHRLEGLALATQEVGDVNAPTFGPKHIVNLASRMLSLSPRSRPVISQVDTELVELGGIDQVYHSPCCKKSSRFLTERMNTRLKLVVDERDRLRAEHAAMQKRLEVLEAKDVTYESRIMNEAKKHTENIAKLQAQLDKERQERRRLQELVADLQQQSRRPPRPGVPRPASDQQALYPSPSRSGLVMRKLPRPHPLPAVPSQQTSVPSPIQPRAPATADAPGSRLSYSQTVAVGITPRPPQLPAASRRESLIPTPSPAAISAGSPTPDTAGFTLRSRNSGSRLPLAVNPSTPIRSNSPVLNRDLSSTDSTQYSLSSSTFSRLGASRHSLAETSFAGTPPPASPAMVDKRRVPSPITMSPQRRPSRNDNNAASPIAPAPAATAVAAVAAALAAAPVSEEFFTALPHEEGYRGLGLVMTERRESFASGGADGLTIRDTDSVASSAAVAPGDLSPILSGSALSSPRVAHASVEGHRGGGFRIPPMPTARSWADVARRERRG